MLFGIANITKTYTTAIILLLEDEKKLSLNDKINKWLPSFPNIDGTITIRQNEYPFKTSIILTQSLLIMNLHQF